MPAWNQTQRSKHALIQNLMQQQAQIYRISFTWKTHCPNYQTNVQEISMVNFSTISCSRSLSVSHVSGFQLLPIQSKPVCKLPHSPSLYYHNHQNGIRKTTTTIGHVHFCIIVEKQCGAFVCVMTAAGPTQHFIYYIINGMFSESVLTNLNNKVLQLILFLFLCV